MNTISFTREKVQQLQAMYDKCVTEGKEQFTFDCHEILTAYAKYLLMHLHNQFGETKNER